MGRIGATFADVATNLQNTALQATVVIDRDKARVLGVTADQLRTTLYTGFGTKQVSTIFETGDSYQVIVEFDRALNWTADRLDLVRIRASNGKLIPLSAFASVERTAGPLSINQLGQLPGGDDLLRHTGRLRWVTEREDLQPDLAANEGAPAGRLRGDDALRDQGGRVDALRARRDHGPRRRLHPPVDLRSERRMSDDPLDSDDQRVAEDAAADQADEARSDREAIEDIPGLARLAASAAWHTTEWAAREYARMGLRVLGLATQPDKAQEFAGDVRGAVGDYARAATGQGQREPAGAEDEDDSTQEWIQLRVLGAEVMRKSRDVNYEETAHPAYERILGDIAPDEARILRLFMLNGPQPTIDIRTGGPLSLLSSRLIAQGISMIGARAGCRYPSRVPQYLNNLNRLGMIWFSRETLHDPVPYQVLEAQPEALEAAKSVRMAKIVRRSIHLTPFGEDFCRICLAIDDEELEHLPEHARPADPEEGEEPAPHPTP